MSRQQQSQAFKSYCAAIANQSGLQGQALAAHIQETIRQSYFILFNDRNIRQRNMTASQLEQLSQHREQMVYLMNLKASV